MEQAVIETLGERKPEELHELKIEGVQSKNIEGIDKTFTQLEKLELLNCGLESLSSLPNLPTLNTLNLSDNKLKGKENIELIVQQCPKAELICIVGNEFESIDDLKPLESLESLSKLDLLMCPLTQQSGYREKIWNLLPKLVALDGLDANGDEIFEKEEEEEEEEEEDDDEEEVGLDYLQREISSDDEEDDYNPEIDDNPPSDDHDITEDGDDDGDADDAGPSRKKIKLDQSLEQQQPQQEVDQ